MTLQTSVPAPSQERETRLGLNPSFLIVGFPESGTTLVHQMMDAHSRLAVAPEVHWITDYFDTPSGWNVEGLFAWPLLAKWVDQKRFQAFAIDGEQLKEIIAPDELVPCPVFLSRIFELYGKVKGKELVGSHTPEYVGFIPTLNTFWPQAKFIHLIRDGRDVCLSFLKGKDLPLPRLATWTEDPVTTMALWWMRKVQRGREAGRSLKPDLYYELRYEALVARPEEEAARLCDFLGVPYEASMLRSRGESAQATTVRHGDWRKQMSEADLERFEAAAGEFLDELGYARTVARPRPEVLAHVSRLRELFAHPVHETKPSPSALRRRRRKARKTNPFVFIVGCPRSGTTLLQRLLDAHPDLAICDETFWVVYYFKKRLGLTPEGVVTPELISRLFEYHKFYRMKMTREDLMKSLGRESQVPYSTFVAKVFDHYGDFRGKPLVGDKTPDYVRNLPTLHFLWPQAKFIHLIRDGRDVCLSAINWKRKVGRLKSLFSTWEQQPVVTAALWWEWHVRQGREAGRSLGPGRYYELRYESLVARPEEECARLCAFLDLSYDEAMLNFHQGRTRVDGTLDAKNSWLAVTPGLRDWRTQMPAEDVERFEAAAGTLLDELNYPRAFTRSRTAILTDASRIRETFRHDATALGDWLP